MRNAAAFVLAFAVLGGCHVHHHDHFLSFWPGDFNADGIADVAVGAPLDDDGTPGSDRGRVYVYFGSSVPDATGDVILSGAEAGSQFGFSVAAIGDFNGDGRADLAAGAPREDAGGTDRGRVYIFFGGAGFGTSDLVLSGTEDNGRFGSSVARAGDVNGDNIDDLLVGAPLEDAGGTDRGRAYLFLGGVSPSTSPALTFSGGEDLSEFGRAVGTAGDFDGDGFFDWLIGAPLDDADGNTTNEGIDRGRVFFYRGSGSPNNSVDLTIDGAEDGARFGWSVAGLRDVDVDGYDDFAAGAPRDDGDGVAADSGADLGRVYLFFGSAIPDSTVDLTFTGAEEGSRFGEMVARVGDVNAGGAPDMLVGAPGDDADGNATENGLDRGRAFLFFGGPSMDNVADVVYTGAEDGGEFGFAADSPGDVNEDGFRDVVIGAPLDDADGNAVDNGLDRGRAFLFPGAFSPSSAAALVLSGAEDGAELGEAVAKAAFTAEDAEGRRRIPRAT